MKKILKLTAVTILLLIVSFPIQSLAQRPGRMGPASSGEIKKRMQIVTSHPDSVEAYKSYIYAMGMLNPALKDQYNTWSEQYPENVTIPLAFGIAYYNAEMPQAKEFLLKAASLAPQNAEIWSMLSIDAFRWGQTDLSTEYKRKAMLADTTNADYAVSYLMDFENEPNYSQKVSEFIKRFPTNERGAMALYWAGENATNVNDKIIYFEQLRRLHAFQKFSWWGLGVRNLADIYLQTNLEKALGLIADMGERKDVLMRKQVAESLIEINQLEKNKNYTAAIAELDKVKLPKYNNFDNFITLKKASLREQAGDVKTAYDSVIAKFAKLPAEELYAAAVIYGEKIGKDKKQVDKEIGAIRDLATTVACPFKLGLYTSSDSLNLKDLKGKVVLLTFWFPGCGPCRAEFPHFEAVISKFKGENVAYVGVNVDDLQAPYVIPFLKNSKYSFIPLRGTRAFAAKNYGVVAEPENFLIDKNGNIAYKDFRIDSSNHQTLEVMISLLLQKDMQSN